MPAFSDFPLQQAVFAVLSADSALSALATGIYDFVPETGVNYPFVTLGEMKGVDWSTKTGAGVEYVLTLRVFSRSTGRQEAAGIMARLYALLHEASLSVSGQTLVNLRFSGSQIALENDGATYQGVMQFTALIESNS